MKKIKTQFGGKSSDYIFNVLRINPVIELGGQKFYLVSVLPATYSPIDKGKYHILSDNEFFIRKVEDDYHFSDLFKYVIENVQKGNKSYKERFESFIKSTKNYFNEFIFTLKATKSNQEVFILVNFKPYFYQFGVNKFRLRCDNHECYSLNELDDKLIHQLAVSGIKDNDLKNVERAYLAMKDFTQNRYINDVQFYPNSLIFEFEQKDYEIDYKTQKVIEVLY